MALSILVTGASIAGNTAAWWLGRYGFNVTVVERAPAFRDGGQNIDVRGPGRAVLRRMGLEAAALAQGTGEEGTAWIDAYGGVAAAFTVDAAGREGPTAEMEILRGDLSRLIYEPARERATYRFGDRIVRIAQRPGCAEIGFESGRTERYDLVIVAEGAGAATRALAFLGEARSRWMDLTIAYFTIPRITGDDRMWRWYNAPGGRSISLRPDRHGTTRAMLTVRQKPADRQDWGADRQKAYLRELFADAGWQAARVLAGLKTTGDFYFDVLRQIRMKRWSHGAVALTGDAAWCATPVAGIGTTLAVTGAFVLAGELRRHGAVAPALAAYERAMRPMVAQAQGVPKIAGRVMNPRSRFGIRLLHNGLRLASSQPVRRLTARLPGGATKTPDLSAYPAPD